MEKWIELSDGTVINDCYIVKEDDDNITIYLSGRFSFIRAYQIFRKIPKVNRIVANEDDIVIEYEGFTRLISLQTDYQYEAIARFAKEESP